MYGVQVGMCIFYFSQNAILANIGPLIKHKFLEKFRVTDIILPSLIFETFLIFLPSLDFVSIRPGGMKCRIELGFATLLDIFATIFDMSLK